MLYTYRAVDQKGQSSSGQREAGSERELADTLRREGYLLLEVSTGMAPKPKPRLTSLPNPFQRVTLVERMVFARNLAVMIGSGLSLTSALQALEAQSANPRFRSIIAAVREGVTKGQTLAESLKPYEGIFGPLFINMIEAGEISGNLERVLKILSRQMARDHDLRSKVRGAMFYPAIVVVTLLAIGVLMMVFVVPTLTQTFAELGIDLPITTRIIIGGSDLLLRYYGYLAVAVVGLIAVAWRGLKSPGGQRAFDTFILKVPIFGPLTQKLNSARFARTLASLIASGIPIIRSLEVTAGVLGNTLFRKALGGAAEAIQRGQALHAILAERAELFPPMVTQMIQVGEETGSLSRMLLRLALFYEEEVSNTTKNLSSIIEPILMIVIGGVVGFFAISMIQPIYSGLGNL